MPHNTLLMSKIMNELIFFSKQNRLFSYLTIRFKNKKLLLYVS